MLVEDAMIEIAKKMLKDGMNINMILKYTNLDESTIQQLQAELE